jgi:hemerythrin
MFVEWNESLEIGVERIDEEHKEIIEEFGKLYSLMRVGSGHDFYPMVIEFLDEYIQNHLDHEEEYQKEIGYDALDEHKEKHAFFKEKVNELKQAKSKGKVSNKDLIDLNLLIKDWFVDHIMVEDVKIAAFVKNKE